MARACALDCGRVQFSACGRCGALRRPRGPCELKDLARTAPPFLPCGDPRASAEFGTERSGQIGLSVLPTERSPTAARTGRPHVAWRSAMTLNNIGPSADLTAQASDSPGASQMRPAIGLSDAFDPDPSSGARMLASPSGRSGASQSARRPRSRGTSRGSSSSRQSSASLSSGAANREGVTYELIVRQHARLAPAAGLTVSTLSRLPLVPAFVVQLVVRDENGDETDAYATWVDAPLDRLIVQPRHAALRLLPRIFAATARARADDGLCALARSEPADRQLDVNTEQGQSHLQVLIGQLTADPQRATDLNGEQCILFVFPDLSVRTSGHFRMRFSLVEACVSDS